MKVALSFPGCHRRGGVERIAFECARFLADRDHEVDVFATDWEEDLGRSIRYHYVPAQQSPYFCQPGSYYRSCTREIKKYAFDVLNTHGCVCPVGGVHWVQSVHRAWLERSRTFRGAYSMPAIRQKLNPIHPLLLRLEALHFRERAYRRIIATTPRVREDLKRLYDIPEEDVTIIPNGYSPEEFSLERRLQRRCEMRQKLALKDDEIVLLLVANELERKGYRTILDAMRRMKRRDVRLIVVGRASADEILRLAQQVGVEDQVMNCGSTADVSQYHAAADIFVLPTQYEAFCLAILEALGSGLPIITSKVPGAQDAILPGVNGLLIDDPQNGAQLESALLSLMDPETREVMGRKAAETSIPFQWPNILSRYEAVLLQYRN